MKRYLLTTPLGHLAIAIRDKINLLCIGLTATEQLPMTANDLISFKLLTEICETGKVFIDVGSHIGSVISEVQYTNDSIKIIGVEAIPEKVAKLRNLYPKVEFFECALGDRSDQVEFYVHMRKSGYSSLLAPDKKSTSAVKKIQVPMKKLDDLGDFQNVDVIKIDVEGAELGVIKGATKTIERNMPIIMFESGPGDEYTKRELWDSLNSLGYGVHLPNRVAHRGNPLSCESFLSSHEYPRHTTNYFAIPSLKWPQYRNAARNILGYSNIDRASS